MVTGTNNTPVQPNAIPTTNNQIEMAAATKRVSDNRRSNKPIMEKRRRARINNSLNELKTLILDAMKKDPARHSKLEKADILEMTVKHLQNLQRQQAAMSAATDPSVVSKFRAGFSECASEVGRFPGLDPVVKRRLLQHLASCLNQGQKEPQVQVIVPEVAPNNIILGNGTGVQLVPTRLANGDIALVLPTQGASPLPLLVPIPQRTASTASSASNYSPSQSPEPESVRPLSLVVRRCEEPTEEKPWRPW
ncbi:Protein hairy-like Protein [Tribolium castaneum]|uniref:Protein hairy-like Protein n=1 Tax=Tribolium castaneum TaxID=7070 RepID=D6X189_TRICA|nr:Protein hairy-like Protein [Tribolium castaneum]